MINILKPLLKKTSTNDKAITLHYPLATSCRIDKYLAEALKSEQYSRSFCQKLINNGQVQVNNKVVITANTLLQRHDTIAINIINEVQKTLKATAIPFKIIYEDHDLMVIDKPNNLIVHPGAGNYDNTLVNGLLYQAKITAPLDTSLRPGIVHRIDKQTTGLLIVAKNNISHNFLATSLKKHEITRIYIALVHGTIKGGSGTIKAPIARSNSNRLKMMVHEQNSKAAITHFEVIERFKNATLVKCQLETGRTHQIRVHFEWIGHPILNDPLYSKFKGEDRNIGQYLHAKVITFVHPSTKVAMTLECDLPDFFENRLQSLRKESVK